MSARFEWYKKLIFAKNWTYNCIVLSRRYVKGICGFGSSQQEKHKRFDESVYCATLVFLFSNITRRLLAEYR